MSEARDNFNEPSAANLPNLVTLKLSRAETRQLQFWSNLAQILVVGPTYMYDSVGLTPLSKNKFEKIVK